ncbi:MAG TPA: ribosome biogenesis factor YjgA [Pseudoxanthomonas sp.]|jgi:ribosome-associated protein|nr:ribosome biogenesis factor YjgA [Pseudoxanthomonas sp.]
MRGRDPETGEFYSPSRSQQREDALEVRSLAEQLVALSAAKLAKLPIPEDLLPHIVETQRITSHIAHKRQLQYLAKQMRRESDETLEAIRDAMSIGGDASRRETALLHRAEHWRDRLLGEGDAALTALLEEYPQAERQKLRQLVRNAADEHAKNKPPHAYRELFRELRELLVDPAETEEDQDDDA